MTAREVIETRSAKFRVAGLLTWLGGAVVLFGAALAWLAASLAVRESARWPVPAILSLTLVFGLLVGAMTRGTVSGPKRGWPGTAGRAAVAVAIGVVVGELAALVVFSGSIDRRLDERALRNADSAPAVTQASAALRQTRDARGALEVAVEQAREHQDTALVVARCEYHPTPACPQTRITGDPGGGPETRTANEFLARAQHELADALAARDGQAPSLDAEMSHREQALATARRGVLADAGRGFGPRWVAMNDLTLESPGALLLRLLTIAFCVLVYLLPLILRLWRGETTHDRHATARAQRDRVDLNADTAIAIKRAEVHREAEIMWAEHQLTQARLAIEAQLEIDREHQRRRVADALEAPVRASAKRAFEPVAEDLYLPIAAEAEAASRAAAQLPSGATGLPAEVEPGDEVQVHADRATRLIPSIPDATKAAARWIRPLVPPFVARVIDNTTAPLRTARQVFEEVEEITFSLKRSRKVTVDCESSDTADRRDDAPAREHANRNHAGSGERYPSWQLPAGEVDALALPRDAKLELTKRDGPRELPPADG